MTPWWRFDELACAVNLRERAEAEEVHLQQADLLDGRALELGRDLLRVGGLVQRDERIERHVRDHDAGRVYGGVPGQALQPPADVEHLVDRRVRVVKAFQVRLARRALSIVIFSSSGTSLAMRSASDSGTSSTRQMSRIAARALSRPKVMIWATWPYFSRT